MPTHTLRIIRMCGQTHRPPQTATLSIQASMDRSCSVSLPADWVEGALVGN